VITIQHEKNGGGCQKMNRVFKRYFISLLLTVMVITQVLPTALLAESSTTDTQPEIDSVETEIEREDQEPAVETTTDASPDVLTEAQDLDATETTTNNEESDESSSNESSVDNVKPSEQSTDVTSTEESMIDWNTTQAQYFKVVGEDATVYQNKTKSLAIGSLTEGQIFVKSETNGNWHTITFGETEGYVPILGTEPIEGSRVQSVQDVKLDGRLVTATETAVVYDNSSGSLVQFATLNEGEQAPILLDYGPNWWRVKVAGKVGYVKKAAVRVDFTPSDDYFKVIEEEVPVYDNRSGSLVQVGTLEKGEVYPRIRDYGNWHQIQFGDYKGYVLKRQTTVATGQSLQNETTSFSTNRTFTTNKATTVYDNSTGALVPYMTILEGKEASIVRDYGNWWEIVISNRTGYVKKSSVSVDFKTTDEYFQVTESDVKVYDNRSGSLVEVGTLEKGEVYPRVRDYGNWHQIQFGSYKGYVLKRQTTVASGASLKNETQNFKANRTLTALEDTTVYDNSSGRLVPFVTITKGKQATIVQDYGNWWEVVISNRTGYVKKSEVRTSFKTTDKFFTVVETETKVYDNRSGSLVELATLEPGTTYERVQDYGNWHQIRFDDYYGYVLKRKTTPGSSRMIPNRASQEPTNGRIFTVLEDTAVYDNSGQSLTPFMTLTKGTEARIDRDYGDWWQVIVGKRIGYINKDHVQVAFKSTDNYFRVLTDDVIIYDNRSGGLKKVGTLKAGQEYRRVSDYGNWHQIQFNNYYGYVKESDTTYTLGTTITNESSSIQSLDDHITFTETVEVYTDHSLNADVIGTIDEGVSYQVVEYNANWHKVLFSNRIGYIAKTDLGIYTPYDLTLSQMADIQLTRRPQTDKYRNEPGYIHSSLVDIVEESIISGDGVALRTEPSTLQGSQTVYARVNTGTTIEILEKVTGTSVSGDTNWYKIRFEGKELYVHVSLVKTSSKAAKLTSTSNVRAAASTSSHIYGTATSGSSVNVLDTVTGAAVNGNTTWYKVSYSTWRLPTKSDILTYLNPDTQDAFQFLVLSEPANVTTTQLNRILTNKGILTNRGSSFIKAGEKYGVNEIYLISHALLETGHGQSALAQGVEVGLNSSNKATLVTASNRSSLKNIKRVYNMYGIGAFDNVALSAGATYAYNNGWFSPEIAIIEGARFVSNNYFSRGQDTLYKMRWNPENPGVHQYATDIGWAAKQIYRMKELYSLLDNPTLKYDIPKYK